jgi:hypothetical protein
MASTIHIADFASFRVSLRSKSLGLNFRPAGSYFVRGKQLIITMCAKTGKR